MSPLVNQQLATWKITILNRYINQLEMWHFHSYVELPRLIDIPSSTSLGRCFFWTVLGVGVCWSWVGFKDFRSRPLKSKSPNFGNAVDGINMNKGPVEIIPKWQVSLDQVALQGAAVVLQALSQLLRDFAHFLDGHLMSAMGRAEPWVGLTNLSIDISWLFFRAQVLCQYQQVLIFFSGLSSLFLEIQWFCRLDPNFDAEFPMVWRFLPQSWVTKSLHRPS